MHSPLRLPRHPPILQGYRVFLRPATRADAAALYANYGDAEVMRYASDPTFESIDTVELLLDGIGRSLLDGTGIEWALCQLNTDHVIGTCGLHSFTPLGEAEVGCLLNRAYWGKGLMHDALRTLIDFARSDLHLGRCCGS